MTDKMATKDAVSSPSDVDPVIPTGTEDLLSKSSHLKKQMSVKKRSITLQLKYLQSDLVSIPKRSRSALRLKSAALKCVVSELRSIVDEALELEEDEEALTRLEEYFTVEQDRVLVMIGEVDEHLEQRLDEANTSVNSNQTCLEQSRKQERNRIRTELEKIQDHARRTKELEGELHSQLEQLDLGERAQDFEEYETKVKNQETRGAPSLPKTAYIPAEWMDLPQLSEPMSFQVGHGSCRRSIRSEVPIFNGDPLHFMNWANMFESLVHNARCSVAEKMGLLRASLGPECLKLVAGFTNSTTDYGEALKLIHKRYGDPQELRRAHLQALRDLPRVEDGDPRNFPSFADGIQGHLRVITRLLPRKDGLLDVLMDELSHKMDREHFFHWDNFAKDLEDDEKIHAFGDWAMERARRDRYFQTDKSQSSKNKMKAQVNGIESKSGSNNNSTSSCKICRGMHKEKNCEKFKILPTLKKREMARNCGLCYLCLESDHYFPNCPHMNTWSCRRDGCGGKHHSWLHLEKEKTNVDPLSRKDDAAVQLNSVHRSGCLGVIPIYCSYNGKEFIANALIDEGSDTSLVSESLVSKLGVRRPKKRAIRLNLVSKEVDQYLSSVKFQIRGPFSQDGSSFEALVLPQVCPNLKPLAWRERKDGMAHLQDLPLIDCDRKVDILVGLDHGDLLVPLEVRRGAREEPYAMRCKLGWVVRGQLPEDQVKHKDSHSINFIHESCTPLETLVRRFFAAETFGSEDPKKEDPIWSLKESFAMKLIEQGTKKILDEPGYVVELPWRGEARPINDSTMAMKRLSSLHKKMERNPDFAEDYKTAIKKYMNNGYAVKVIGDEEINHPQQRWIPHHEVYKDPSQRKLRVVFDSATKYHGESLNDHLYTGPPLQNDLFRLLIRFREYAVASTADVEAMYSRIRVTKDDARFHRFLWSDSSNKEPELFEMTGVVFGDASSPCQAIHVLWRTAEEFGTPELLDLIKTQFYMDDFLNSYKTKEEAISTNRAVSEILSNGNFHLTKWMSNSREVCDTSPAETLDLVTEEGRVLGMSWNIKSDTMSFTLKGLAQEASFTRRKLLGKVAGIFDPLGIASPFTVKGKIRIQHLSRLSLDWYEEVPEEEKIWWSRWTSSAFNLSGVEFDRCLIPQGILTSQIHTFCDASEEAFAAATYLRHVMENTGKIKVALVMARTRLAPTKPISVAKLELNAALLGARLATTISQVLREPIEQRFFWTDSSAVRGWLQGTASFFKPFVSNRIGEIQTLTTSSEWRHVPGKFNPADLATRSEFHPDVVPKMWIHGPEFLKREEIFWPNDIKTKKNFEDIKPKFEIYSNTIESQPTHSHWWKDLKTLDEALKKITKDTEHLERDMALKRLILWAQQESFHEELNCVKRSKDLRKTSRLLGLTPFLDDDQLLRVGGRLERAQVPYDLCHPIVLDPKHPLTILILDDLHVRGNHGGTNHALYLLRQTYHVLRGREAVKKAQRRCDFCVRRSAKPLSQLMSGLPPNRLDCPSPPFYHTSVDYFGPYQILVSRNKTDKRWGAIFTCLTTRAVHLEVSRGLSSENFLMAFRMFETIRGRPATMYSDNGTNFIGARKVVAVPETGITWNLQPPGAPHWGGAHEALVKSVKRTMDAILAKEDKSKRHLKEDEFRMLLGEIMAFLNSRPLGYESGDPNEPSALTPNHFLLLRPNQTIPARDYQQMSPRKHYHYLQKLIDDVWKRWNKEFLPLMLARDKWRNQNRNLLVGDMVLVVDPLAPRGQWKVGPILEVFPGNDGLVRAAKVNLSGGALVRPITKLCLLQPTETSKPDDEKGGEDAGTIK